MKIQYSSLQTKLKICPKSEMTDTTIFEDGGESKDNSDTASDNDRDGPGSTDWNE